MASLSGRFKDLLTGGKHSRNDRPTTKSPSCLEGTPAEPSGRVQCTPVAENDKHRISSAVGDDLPTGPLAGVPESAGLQYAESVIEEYHMDDEEDAQPEESELGCRPSRKEARRQRVCTELLDTEQRYVLRLEDLITIRYAASKIFADDIIRLMFLNIDVIYKLHENFLPKIRERILNWTEGTTVGDLMLAMTSFMKLYTEYVQGVKNAMELVQSWRKKNKAFNNLINDFSKQIAQPSIDSRMMDPVQRIPRYELLLKEYRKCLPEDSKEAKDIQESIDNVSKALRYFETMIEHDNKVTELLKLQRSLESPVNIFSFSREIVMDAAGHVMNAKAEKFQECHIYLLSDLLLITRDVHAMKSVKKKIKHLMNLAKTKVSMEGANDRCLVVYTRIAQIEIQFNTRDEMIRWEQAIRYRLVEVTKKKLIRRGTWEAPKQRLFQSPPQFALLHTTQVCMSCGQDFDTPKRKKHCDGCGAVVCTRCSPHRESLPYDKETVHRVCHSCYAELCKMKLVI